MLSGLLLLEHEDVSGGTVATGRAIVGGQAARPGLDQSSISPARRTAVVARVEYEVVECAQHATGHCSTDADAVSIFMTCQIFVITLS